MGTSSHRTDELVGQVRSRWRELALWMANRAWRIWWLVWITVAVLVWQKYFRFTWPMGVTVFFSVVACAIAVNWAKAVYAERIRQWPLPRLARHAWLQAYQNYSARDVELVERGLRQFFLACLKSRPNLAHMPSRSVDALWHHMILDTKSYERWCKNAAGFFVHHHPAQALGRDAFVNDSLRRTWFWTCKEESIDPRNPTRLPLLFALDAKLRFPGGLHYKAAALAAAAAASSDGGSSGGGDSDCHYGTDFNNSGYPGGSDSFGGADGGGGDGGGDGGGGCGGGD